jgi:hypothetical protein
MNRRSPIGGFVFFSGRLALPGGARGRCKGAGGYLERFPFRLTVSRICKVCGAFGTRDFVKTSSDGLAQAVDGVGGPLQGVGGDLAEDGFELGEYLLDRVEIGTVCGKIDKDCTAGFDGVSHAGDFVNRDIVHEHDVTSFQSRNENLFDIGSERLAVHRSFEHEGRGHTVVAQRSDERGSLPVAVQHLVDETLAARRTAVEAGDIGRNAGFIDEDEPLWIKPRLPPSQGLTRGGDVRPILLGGVQAFF